MDHDEIARHVTELDETNRMLASALDHVDKDQEQPIRVKKAEEQCRFFSSAEELERVRDTINNAMKNAKHYLLHPEGKSGWYKYQSLETKAKKLHEVHLNSLVEAIAKISRDSAFKSFGGTNASCIFSIIVGYNVPFFTSFVEFFIKVSDDVETGDNRREFRSAQQSINTVLAGFIASYANEVLHLFREKRRSEGTLDTLSGLEELADLEPAECMIEVDRIRNALSEYRSQAGKAHRVATKAKEKANVATTRRLVEETVRAAAERDEATKKQNEAERKYEKLLTQVTKEKLFQHNQKSKTASDASHIDQDDHENERDRETYLRSSIEEFISDLDVDSSDNKPAPKRRSRQEYNDKGEDVGDEQK